HHVPKTLDDALQTLAEVAPKDGRVLAGGQSLVPIMAFRLAKPAHLVDINGVTGLDKLASDGKTLSIGACVRHAAFPKAIIPTPRAERSWRALRVISRTIRSARAARSAEVSRTPIPHRNGAWSRRRSTLRSSHEACAAPAASRQVFFLPASWPRPWRKTSYSP